MRPFLALVLVLAAAAGVYVLVRGPGEPPPAAPDPDPAPDAPTAERGTLTGSGTRRPEVPAAEDPYAQETDWEKLGRGLWLNSDRERAVKRAVELLQGKPGEIRKLVRRLHPDAGETQHSGQSIFRGVAQTLVQLGPENLEMLLEELDDENAVYRTRVVALAGSFGRDADRIVPALLERFHAIDENPPAGECASYINAFRFIGPAAKAILPVLERWIDEGAGSKDVEAAALRAIAYIAGPTEAVFDRYREVLRHDGWEVQRRAVLQTIGELGAAAAPLIPHLLELVDDNLLSEGAAMHTLAHIGVPDPRVLERAEKGLRAVPAEWEGLGWSAYALAKLGDEGFRRLMAVVDERGLSARARLVPVLNSAGYEHERIFRLTRPALTSPDVADRRMAWTNLADLHRLGAETEAAVLEGLGDSDPDVRIAVIVIATFTPTPPVLRSLLERLEDSQEDTRVRMEAARVLVAQPAKPPERVYNAVLALHRAAPERNAVYFLHRWLAARPGVVLRLWGENLPPRGGGRLYWGFVRGLPAAVRRRHADAVRRLGLDPETAEALARPDRAAPAPPPPVKNR